MQKIIKIKYLLLIFVFLISLIYFNNVNAEIEVCTGAELCSDSYILDCKLDAQPDGFCPEDYGDWSKCPTWNTGGRCYPCDPDCKYTKQDNVYVRDPNGKSICSPINLMIDRNVNPGDKINIFASVINPSLPNELNIYRGDLPDGSKTCTGVYNNEGCLLASNPITSTNLEVPPKQSVYLLPNEAKQFSASGSLSYKWNIQFGKDICEIRSTSQDTTKIELKALKEGKCTLRLANALNELHYVEADITISKCNKDLDCDDKNSCTQDKCNKPSELSSYGTSGAYCTNTNLNPDSACTTAYGASGVCNVDIPSKCVIPACSSGTGLDCNDNNVCTKNVCNSPGSYGAYCSYPNEEANTECTTALGSYGVCNIDIPSKCVIPICKSGLDCDDSNTCTTDTCNNAENYNAACSISSTITICSNNDQCCPGGAYGCNANNDNACTAVCGNGVIEIGETCSTCPQDVSSTEVCNGIDDDCDGFKDEGGVCSTLTYYCDKDNDAYKGSSAYGTCTTYNCVPGGCSTTAGNDCNDNNANIRPGATEQCNGIDDDCSGGLPSSEYDLDGDGYMVCQNDCNDNDNGINPGASDNTCDGVNQNCNGAYDEQTPDSRSGIGGIQNDFTCSNSNAYGTCTGTAYRTCIQASGQTWGSLEDCNASTPTAYGC